MKRNMIKRIAAVAMAGAMMVSMSVPAMAEGDTSIIKELKIEKHLLKEANTYTPGATYSFTIEKETENLGKTEQGLPIMPGVENGVDSTVTIRTPENIANAGIGETDVTIGTGTIKVYLGEFKEPGIYRYKIKENDCPYEGITEDNSEKYIDIYIFNEEGELTLGGCAFVGQDTTQGKDKGIFNNSYVQGANDLTVTKKIDGNQVSDQTDFSFDISVEDEDEDNEKYYVTFSDGREAITLVSGGAPHTITLKANQSVTIHGLSENDTYTVTEHDYSDKGYTTKIDDVETRLATGTITTDDEIEVWNIRNTSTPTGIVMDIAPYIIMVAAAGVLAFVFLRRRSYTK